MPTFMRYLQIKNAKYIIYGKIESNLYMDVLQELYIDFTRNVIPLSYNLIH